MSDDSSRQSTAHRGAELTTWSIIYAALGWFSLAAATFGGEGEAPYYLVTSLTLLPLAIGFWFRWSWSRWAGFVIFGVIMVWAIWHLAHQRVLLLSIALLLTSAETLWCLWRWPVRSQT